MRNSAYSLDTNQRAQTHDGKMMSYPSSRTHRGHLLIAAGAALGFLSVFMGVFGAGLFTPQIQGEALGWWSTATTYLVTISIIIVVLGALTGSGFPHAQVSGWLFVVGGVLFAGSLYAMAASNMRWLGAITPIGGTFLIAGCLWLAFGAFRKG